MKANRVGWIAIILLASTIFASAQTAKQLKTSKGKPVGLLNLVSPKADCTIGTAPMSVPVIREKPSHGVVQMIVLFANVPASGVCPTRKIPVITLIYSPKADFVGSDSVTLDVDDANRTTALSYDISVLATGDAL
ncbi:hypothetical protein [uncultured Bradyrhizobium sp.]|jgi:hypothetical protein|uniref:hypothetical protein n=1 Tax=uncultured Bradyrhizobium sp. TaxID=199684 RepID=UPI002607AD9F|nr:hypothetical protein [uncultured Bradyrhizobium sp.]